MHSGIFIAEEAPWAWDEETEYWLESLTGVTSCGKKSPNHATATQLSRRHRLQSTQMQKRTGAIIESGLWMSSTEDWESHLEKGENVIRDKPVQLTAFILFTNYSKTNVGLDKSLSA